MDFVRVLVDRAKRGPHEIAFQFLTDGEAPEIRVTYGGLDRQARAIAAALQGMLRPGDRTLLLCPPGLDFVAAFFGSLYAGAVAVPAYPPESKRRPGAVERLVGIIENARPSVILTTSIALSAVERLREYGRSSSKLLGEIPCVTTDSPDLPEPERWRAPTVRDDTIAFLQYTSGSTGAPKGAIVSHGNLYHNSLLIKEAFGHSSESRGVIWLPPYHDMGLIGGILQPVFAGFPCVLLSPLAFLQRPFRWLDAVSRYRATTSGGPNFAYDLCVERIGDDDLTSLDLSSWEVAFNGSEPVRQDTLHRFASKFSRCGFRRAAMYPCYGLAEATLFVTGGFASEEPTTIVVDADELSRHQSVKPDAAGGAAAKLLSSGHAGRDHRVVIAEPDSRRTCSPGSVGEIWVAGPSVARGYWRHQRETEEAFAAHLADTGEGPFLRTGDLGFLKNGELWVTGRLKDLIIIRGRNYHPHDVERVVEQSHDGLRSGWGAAFSVDGDGEERLVVVYEVKRRYREARDDETDSIITAIREAISEALHLEVSAVQLIRPGQIPKTSSGKVQRLLCRERFLAGKLELIRDWRRQMQPEPKSEPDPIVAPPPTDRESLQRWMVSQLSRHLRVEPTEIDVQAPFARYGVDSKQAVSWSGELEDKLGRRLPPTLFYEYPTIESVADYLVGSGVGETPSSIEAIAAGAGNHEPIAIIGMGCRFPGAENIQAFWTLLREGVDAIGEVPQERWDVEALYDPNPDTPGRMNIRWGGFLKNVDQFDPQFFGIAPREALRMDPQQRLLLEVTWEALEDAGLPPERLSASSTAVFVGISNDDYGRLQIDDPALSDAYAGTGSALSIAANRISYLLNLRGPSMAIDTACSSSLVAVHLACQSLQRGESNLALAGGVNLMLSPGVTVNFARGGFLSPDGRCKAFDSRANGYVRGEGVGMLLLKPLTQALRDGDPIWALIRGSAVNQDGRSNGLTAPNPESQEAVLRQAYANAGISPGEVQYVEAHGTGTFLGDPMEANALGKVLASGRPAGSRCTVGSVKTNIGHLEAAAGVAGLIKVALSLKHGAIPPNLHFEDPNPHIAFDELPLEVPTRLAPWPASPKAALAGVSSFGFGGTNAHVVLQEAPKRDDAERSADGERAYLLPVSAHTPEALTALVSGYREFLSREELGESTSLRDICYTASVRRMHHRYRASVVARSPEQASARLEALAQQQGPVDAKAERRRKVAFVFSGQGSQWLGMGRELLEQESVFRERVEQCDELFRPLSGWSVLEELTADASRSRLVETGVAQPVLFALQLALAEQWRSWGVVADVVVGHSLGEIAAATVAGVLRLEDAVRLVAHRARLCQAALEQGHKGKMAAVGLSVEEAERAVERYGERLVVAAHNSPTSAVVSGEPEAVEELSRSLAERNVFTRLIQGEVAFHSPQMEPLAQELEQALAELEPQPSTIPIVSTVTGRLAEGESFDAHYWGRNLRERVRFASAIEALPDTGSTTFVELAPHPALALPITQSLESTSMQGQTSIVLPSLSRHQPDRDVMLQSLGRLYELGHSPLLRRLFDDRARSVPLPRYPWQRKRYWGEPEESRQERLASVHPLLGRRLMAAHPTWENTIDLRVLRFLGDHRVNGIVQLPASAFIELGLAASREVFGAGARVLEDLEILKPCTLAEGEVTRLQVVLNPRESTVEIYSRPPETGRAWTHHASGTVRRSDEDSRRPSVDLDEIRGRCRLELEGADCYRKFADVGLHYGADFRVIDHAWCGDGETLVRVKASEGIVDALETYELHPALLDGCLQAILTSALPRTSRATDGTVAYLPVEFQQVRIHGVMEGQLWSHARVVEKGDSHLVADLSVLDEGGRLLARFRGIRARSVAQTPAKELDGLLYEYEWRFQPLPCELAAAPRVALPSPVRIREITRLEASKLEENLGLLEESQHFESAVRTLCVDFILRALGVVGACLESGEQFEYETLVRRVDVEPRHRRLLARLLEVLAEDGIVQKVDAHWEVREIPVSESSGVVWRRLWKRFPAFNAELLLLGRCGERLGDVLRGRVDPLQLIFPEGSLTTVEQLYQDAPSMRFANRLAARALKEILCEVPSVRILEVGAGTGGLTSHVLPLLDGRPEQYVFTDVSKQFLIKAEEKFCDYPFLRYRHLDLETDPEQQSFEPHSFDVILAPQVLHATADLGRTLDNLKQLLASDGLLVLMELTKPIRWVDLVFGLTDGWWRFSDTERRPSYPLLSPGAWRSLLEERGFSEVSEASGVLEPTLANAVFMARGPRLARPEERPRAVASPERTPGSWVVLSDNGGRGDRLAESLVSRGERVFTVFAGHEFERLDGERFRVSPRDGEQMRRLLEEIRESHRPRLKGIVHLWNLDAPSEEALTSESIDETLAYGCLSVVHCVTALNEAGRSETPRLWLVTGGAQSVGREPEATSVAQAPAWGLNRVIHNEFPQLRATTVDLSRSATEEEIHALAQELLSSSPEDEIALRGHARYIHRYRRTGGRNRARQRRVVAPEREAFRLEIGTPGVLSDLSLRAIERLDPAAEEVEIQVVAAGLDSSDVMTALGTRPESAHPAPVGIECAGRITRVGRNVMRFEPGDEVLAIANFSLGSPVTTHHELVMPKPSEMSFEQAATIPIAFLTAHYALNFRGRLARGERVLIHPASGGVGLAAMQLASRAGAEIFASAESPEERALLRRLGVEHVMDSLSPSFGEQTLEATGGRGVDVVLNSLSGDAIAKSLAVLGDEGRFLDIGKRDIYENRRLDLKLLRKGITFASIDLDRILRSRPALVFRLFEELMNGFREGILHPLPYRIFPISNASGAFRHLAQAQHIGKVVVSLEERELSIDPPTEARPDFCADASYLITGGFGGFGLEVAKWMVEHGARHLVLMGRSGAASSEAMSIVEALRQGGTEVLVAKGDVAVEEDVKKVLGSIEQSMPALRGIVHAAMVLRDAPLLELTEQDMQEIWAPKVKGAWNLHRQTLDLKLDFFVLFSSISAVFGIAGQGSYASANTFLNSLAFYRRSRGLPALSVDWGYLGEVGFVARHNAVGARFESMGVRSFTPREAVTLLGRLLVTKPAQVGVVRADWRQFAETAIARRVSPRFSELLSASVASDSSEAHEDASPLEPELLTDLAPEERERVVLAALRSKVSSILGVSNPSLDISSPLNYMGLDSLMAVELKNWVQVSLGTDLDLAVLLEGPTITELARHLTDELDATHARPSDASRIPRVSRRDPLPLSFSQLRMWLLDQLDPGNPVWNLPAAVRIEGRLDVSLFERCLNEVIRRHEVLRAVFPSANGKATQRIAPELILHLGVSDMSALPLAEREAEAQRRAVTEAGKAFDLGIGPLVRCHVLQLGPQEHVVLLTLQHIATDGLSLAVLLKEIGALYAAFAKGEPSPLQELPVQYADFAKWQQDRLQAGVFQDQLDYWKRQLAGSPPLLDLPTDRRRSPDLTYHGAIEYLDFPRDLYESIEELGREEGCSFFVTLLSGFSTLLSRYSGQEDIAVGTFAANRSVPELEGMIGLFVNNLVLRTDLSGQPSFRELMARVREVVVGAFRYQDLPFERLLDALPVDRDPSRTPLFQVAFATAELPSLEIQDFDVSLLPVDRRRANFDLTFWIDENPDGVQASFEYNTQLFDRGTMQRLAANLETLLRAAVAEPHRRISELPVLSDSERRRLLVDSNETTCAGLYDRNYIEVFQQRAASAPDAIAAVCTEAEVTYAALNRRANRWARLLIENGVGPDKVVAVLGERSVDFLTVILAILKAGGAYLPLDPRQPPRRIAQVVEASGAALVVAQQEFESVLANAAKSVPADRWPEALWVHEDLSLPEGGTDLPLRNGPQHLAYVLYTSGSTGVPKGVMIEHRGMMNHLEVMIRELELTESDRIAQTASQCFDISVWQFLTALLVGGSVHLFDDEVTHDPPRLLRSVERHGVTILQTVPSMLQAMLEESVRQGASRPTLVRLRWLLPTGEALPPQLSRDWLRLYPDLPLLNAYGPAECSDDVTFCLIREAPPEDAAHMPVGRPVANMQVYVLDRHMNPVPAGVRGELYICGIGLARGYINRPEWTAERFLPNPFSEAPGARLYQTGDLVRWADGQLEFLGRNDDQVKLRGYRIELGEIESVLTRNAAVSEAAVDIREDGTGTRRLVAYLVGENGSLDAAQLRAFSNARLPDYMVPSAFVVLDALPLTPNGKLDRKRLPPPPEQLVGSGGTARTPQEKLLTEIMADVLRRESVGIHDNFFELGGDSILAIQIVARASQAGLHFSPMRMFEHQTVAELAAVAEGTEVVEAEQAEVVGLTRFMPYQRWFFEQDYADPHHWNMAVGLDVAAGLDVPRLRAAVRALVEHHDALRMCFERDGTDWRQTNVGIESYPVDDVFVQIDLSHLSREPERVRETEYEKAAAAIHASLNLSQGPLLRVAHLTLGPDASRLLLAIHHMIVDGVSWRILLEDLQNAYEQLAHGSVVRLPLKTTSYKLAADRFAAFGESVEVHDELEYWTAVSHSDNPELPVDDPKGAETEGSVEVVSVALGVEETRLLLEETPRAYNTQINDLLLTALVQGMGRWTGGRSLLLDLEGHGREEVMGDVDLSRTVGCFTALFPVHLELDDVGGPGEDLKAVKQRLRQIPNRGFGYGILRYSSPDSEVRHKLAHLPRAQVSFNYLGQFDQLAAGSSLLARSHASLGPTRSPRAGRSHRFEILAEIFDGRLRLDWRYSRNVIHRKTAERVAGYYLRSLQQLIRHCVSPEAGGFTASDFPLAPLSPSKLNTVLHKVGGDSGNDAWRIVENLYAITPIQHGLLFHTLYDSRPETYFLQNNFLLDGDLDLNAFRESWRRIIARHSMLRTAFIWEGVDEPLQVVHRSGAFPFEVEDISGLPEEEKHLRLAAYLDADLRRGFDLSKPTALRLAVVRTGLRHHRFIWSIHHILIDAWSVGLLFKEFTDTYEALARGQAPPLLPAPSYHSYVGWLQQADLTTAEKHWRELLKGFSEPTRLTIDRLNGTADIRAKHRTSSPFAKEQLRLSAGQTEALHQFARKRRLTMNTVLHAAWAVVLSHLSGREEVVFGSVVSGRPPAIPRVEWMVGLFINTLPVRLRLEPRASFSGWLQELQTQQSKLRDYEYASLNQVQRWSDMPPETPIFETILGYENQPLDSSLRSSERQLQVVDATFVDWNHFPLSIAAIPDRELLLEVKYQTVRFAAASIARIAHLLGVTLGHLASTTVSILADLQRVVKGADEDYVARQEQELRSATEHTMRAATRRSVGEGL